MRLTIIDGFKIRYKMMNKHKIIFIFILSLLSQFVQAQVDSSFQENNLSFNEYIQLVSEHNLGYNAEKLNIDISNAAIDVAKIVPDPTFSFGWTDNSESNVRAGYDIASEVGFTLEMGRKRKARIDLARSESELTKALVLEYFRNLQADASLVYIEALKQNYLFKVKYDSYVTMKQLAKADSIRFKLGSIMQIDAMQSTLETGILLNELFQSKADWANSLHQLTFMTGVQNRDSVYFPTGSLNVPNRSFMLENLIATAQNNRADLMVALNDKDVSEKALNLARKQRITDIDLCVGVENSYLASNGTQSVQALTAGISIPLKFSNLHKGELKIAQLKIQQTEELYRQAELQIENEIKQSLQYYNASCKQIDNFDKGLLENALSVKKGKVYSYERGETSLLEVLNAQRTYNEIQTAYYDALYNRAAALIELEKAAGIWDIDF